MIGGKFVDDSLPYMTEIVKLMKLYEWSRYIENPNAVLPLCTIRKPGVITF